MSSCPTARGSTTSSSSSCRSRPDPAGHGQPAAAAGQPVAVIACGALGGHLREICQRRGWQTEIVCLPAMLHNDPAQIAPEAERIAAGLLAKGSRVVLAYADCGSYGALDER